ncbi:hypothetical protein CONPUDRAFT_158505 [Coniophora puteana RWD-64-598 SS2]|uniref:Uncharacterized protein n=1 Tax=Coniophora puteana (strain RWD-64-598) TaxID=741705 RepID=A0A5M3MBU9_CONPW|nr:uncharacterized protein CONPUDRAFT_158505 [Coniophora puteana RWD-64-598 SS2]EIW76486.1 hypothetical protein CONPUDRAFT_158505 [Coniophora puteana RWD-64-598 SS2]
MSDPTNETLPDFSTPEFTLDREAMHEDPLQVDHAAAAKALERRWAVEHARRLEAWNRQVEVSRLAEEQAAADHAAASDQEAQAQAALAAEALAEDRKKYKHKHTPVPDRPMPDTPQAIAHPFAVRRMEEGEPSEIWWWTPAGIRFAATASLDPDGDALVQVTNALTGVAEFKPAVAIRDPKAPVVKDRYLSYEDLAFGTPLMITAMRENNWEPTRVNWLYKFWSAILSHPWWYRQEGAGLHRAALLQYQEEQRAAWHRALKAKVGYKLEINERHLDLVRERLFYQVLYRTDGQLRK